MNALLVELLTEELPPKALKKLGEAFAAGLRDGLAARKLLAAGSVATAYATPRRLAVHITQVATVGPDEARRDKVLPVAVALGADGTPQPPLLKKLAALGLSEADIPRLTRAMDGKAEALFHEYTAPGQALADALQTVLTDTVAKLPIPKVMFYERDDGTAVNFVRPAHKLIALHGSSVVPVSVLGLQAGNVSLGHRFHCEDELVIASADTYASSLREHGKVVASFAERRASIEAQLKHLSRGDEVIAPDALLDEVTALVEWPVVYECHFEREFLEVPQECLILTMQTNQKYFATQKDGKLTNRFLIVSNIETTDPSQIIGGNERVVRPRLADARFFFTQDKKLKLADRLPKLASVVYHNKLGSQGERNARVVAIAQAIATMLKADAAKAERAAMLSKADLVTDMVGEFPELQGIMGRYYALHDGEDTEVAEAIKEHYQPRFAGDALPATTTGTIVALADKLETLAGLFAIGQLPTGDKDPFALRRHALGVIRMLIEKDLPLAVPALVQAAFGTFKTVGETAQADLLTFVYDRLVGALREQGYSAQEVDAVISLRPNRWGDIPRRLEAVRAFAALPESQALAAANKRIGNILKKAEGEVPGGVDAALLKEPAEQALHNAMHGATPIADKLFANGEYTASLRELASLRAPVDAFFDGVMVNAEDAALRNNRLALLKQLHEAMNRVADLSKLAV
ncbi:glycine--tRNA ligase subunit beta [Piscinibacterium candidicorallinum]|uniref:Glycine--tRNA ligase beta subunit n=1 Tax=Piscinibacterium candidicorallinum TaxID=1793872 RepID=A0ABV7H0X9_9BURK